MASTARPLLVVLTGPTGSGKSELALRLAERLSSELTVEIVSVDSAQVYRGMDVGTAKPSCAERARVAHHLIDIRDPSERYSAGEFVRDATAAIDAIHARAHLPLLVGGTMLYLRALYAGIASLPAASAPVRRQIDAEARELGWPALHAALARVDPGAAARIQPQDAQRIQRALEVHRLTGSPLSLWHAAARASRCGARERYRWWRYALWPEGEVGRALLRERQQRRWARMWQAGVLEEVKALYARGDLSLEHAAVRAVGYRQLWQCLLSGSPPRDAEPAVRRATAQLAKRQLTWLRSEPDIRRLPMPTQASELVGLVEVLRVEILSAARA